LPVSGAATPQKIAGRSAHYERQIVMGPSYRSDVPTDVKTFSYSEAPFPTSTCCMANCANPRLSSAAVGLNCRLLWRSGPGSQGCNQPRLLSGIVLFCYLTKQWAVGS